MTDSALNTATPPIKSLNIDANKVALNAIEKIAPTWPLDKMIAVNPFWNLRDRHADYTAAYLSALAGVKSYLCARDYLKLHQDKTISDAALLQAAEIEGAPVQSIVEIRQALLDLEDTALRWRNISDLLDQSRGEHQMSWQEEIVQQISQFCAAHYQNLQPLLQQQSKYVGTHLYKHWLSNVRQDRGIEILMSEPGLSALFKDLPDEEEQLIQEALEELEVSEESIGPYLHGLLLDVNGWASYVAYLRWQKDLGEAERDDGISIVAIRLAWELILYRHTKAAHSERFSFLSKAWQVEQESFAHRVSHRMHEQQILRVWAKALELSEQAKLRQKLFSSQLSAAEQSSDSAIKLQAVFCIDVRSEVIRRALEAQDSSIRTFGFAGFFGLPIAFHAKDTELSRPQLPGLLAPQITAEQRCDAHDDKSAAALSDIQEGARWKRWGLSAGAGFSMVESTGWLHGFKMLKQTLMPSADENPVSQLTHHHSWILKKDGVELTIQDKVELCKGILLALGIEEFAPVVMLVGHGSHTANNLQAAGLDCGACGGQTGEVNVRVLAQLLNDADIREGLHQQGLNIHQETTFVAALHNTTTDNIELFQELADSQISHWLFAATTLAQEERSQLLNPDWKKLSSKERGEQFSLRSDDWSEVRPEWGLANNQAFVIAPRDWSKHGDLSGRVFLHDYRRELDPDCQVLELLMTAPMIVTNWINMQYNASVLDNQKYGSGNKVLHNAVGGNLGIFEGNGGDLRIGLAKQSLNNGKRWMHLPQKLTVYIAAPSSDIQSIVDKHQMVKDLVENEWLHIVQWDKSGKFLAYDHGQWRVINESSH